MFKRNRITSCLVIMFLVINQVSWFSHNCIVVPNNKIIHNCTVVPFIMKCCTIFLQFIFVNKIIVRSDVQPPAWKGYVHIERMINERSDNRFQTPKYGEHTDGKTKATTKMWRTHRRNDRWEIRRTIPNTNIKIRLRAKNFKIILSKLFFHWYR